MSPATRRTTSPMTNLSKRVCGCVGVWLLCVCGFWGGFLGAYGVCVFSEVENAQPAAYSHRPGKREHADRINR